MAPAPNSADFPPGILTLVAFSCAWQWVLGGLACVLLLSGLDDLVPLLTCAFHQLFASTHRPGPETGSARLPERRMAIFVPCWDESQVIGPMVRHNIARIRYRNFDFFLGVYPNDQATCDAAFELAAAFPNVHVSVCPSPGPTSKADCLNAIYKGMTVFEQVRDVHFDTIVLHDAEDVIHDDALSTINRERDRYEMVQVPVLPLPTSPADFTHGIYCDEFAEFQLIDMRARQYHRSFIPSNGVGTGFARNVLERLAAAKGGRVFDPISLTEDYDIGLQIHYAGFRQMFHAIEHGQRGVLATREYFPRNMARAIRQRTRWITGIALQTWERHGWHGGWRTRYWFWRDRKGLITNPLSLLTNVIFVLGAADWVFSQSFHRPWLFAAQNPGVLQLCVATTWLQVVRLSVRSVCVARVFGILMGSTVVLRCFHANFVNCAASLCAVRKYAESRMKRTSLRWEKTEHAYPTDMAGEAAVSVLQHALACSHCEIEIAQVNPTVARSLPARIEKEFEVVPFRVFEGRLHLAGTRMPEAHVFDEIARFTRLPIQFQLVTTLHYGQLQALLRATEVVG
jgi:adsorption protein B